MRGSQVVFWHLVFLWWTKSRRRYLAGWESDSTSPRWASSGPPVGDVCPLHCHPSFHAKAGSPTFLSCPLLQPAYVLQIFPPCEFSESHLSRLAPYLLASISNISPHLMIVIASVSVWAAEWSPLGVFSWGSAVKQHRTTQPSGGRSCRRGQTPLPDGQPRPPACPAQSDRPLSGQWCCYLYVYMTFNPRTDHQPMDSQTPWGWVSLSSFWRKGTGQWN